MDPPVTTSEPAAPAPGHQANDTANGTAKRAALPRSRWHRRAGLVPLGYLAAIVAAGSAHPLLPHGRWLLLHLLVLGAVTNAILIWSAHFAAAILRTPAPPHRRGEAARLVLLNAGVLAVLAAGAAGAPGLAGTAGAAGTAGTAGAAPPGAVVAGWVGVAGAGAVFAAVAAHLAVLAVRLRRALPARFAVTVRFYLTAGLALLAGIPAGAWLLVAGTEARARVLLFHAHVNLLGWVTLTVLGTLLTLWPTALRTRMVEGAARSAARALPLGGAGLVLLATGTLAWWPVLAAAGLAALAGAVALVAVPGLATARQRPPASFATWSIAAGTGWLVVALAADAAVLLRAPDAATAAGEFGGVLVPLGIGFAAQVLLGALAYLLPMVLGGGPAAVRERTARLDAHGAQRVTMANLALGVLCLPVPGYVRIATSVLVLVALVQFLVPAVAILTARRR